MTHWIRIVRLIVAVWLVPISAAGVRAQWPPAPKLGAAAAPSEPGRPRVEELPAGKPQSVAGDFPPLPPDPHDANAEPLPPLSEELWLHGGSHLYQAEGDGFAAQPLQYPEAEILRLPENWQKPLPLTMFSEFLGADPIQTRPRLKWPGCRGYVWEPRFVGYGSYQLFGFALEQNSQRQDAIGHQLVLDLDLRVTGTERFHVQFRPLGRRNSGGSYYQFSDPAGYVDNSGGTPDRYWFEAELHSLLGSFADPFTALDYHVTVGKFPFALHNSLLIDDEIRGATLTKNNLYVHRLSNFNVQAFFAIDDVNTLIHNDHRLYGVNVFIDRRRTFYELTYAYLDDRLVRTDNAHFAAISRTSLHGPLTWAARALFRWSDAAGGSDGQLFALESNYTRLFDRKPLGIKKGVFYTNAFLATANWQPIAGGNLNRLRTSFEVNPLVRIAAGISPSDTWGLATGVQLFRHNEDESFAPELAYEDRAGEPVVGFGLRYQRKTGRRSFCEVLGLINLSDDPRFDREGIFISESILF